MARSVVRVGGVVSLDLSPPLEFIEAQHGEFQRELTDFTGLWDRFADTLQDLEQDTFVTDGHGEWAPLAASTVRQKTASGFPTDIMVRTGRLRKSLTTREIAMRMTPQSMSWGTDVEYAHFHQDGGTTPGRPPQRKLIDIRVEDRRKLEASMVGWINEIAAKTFGRVAA